MRHLMRLMVIVSMLFGLAACGGDKQESADKQAEAQKAIQQGMQKEKAMMEGMQKGVESVEKKATEESKK
jgi:Flp pilus assembly protein TadD